MHIKRWFVLSTALLVLALPALGTDEPRPVVFVTGSSSGSGIRIGPPPALGIRPDILKGIRFAASVEKVELAVTINPGQADYWLILHLNEVAWAKRQTWTLIDAATGIVLEQDHGHLLQNALHGAVEAIRRWWRHRAEPPTADETTLSIPPSLRR